MIYLALILILVLVITIFLAIGLLRNAPLPEGLGTIETVVVQQQGPSRRQYRSRKNKRRSTGGWSGAVAK